MKTLFVITGPTGVGKTGVAIDVASRYDTEIISADSRQLYREIPIGTAAPTSEQLAAVRHHFVGILNLDEYYSAAQFETDSLHKLNEIFATRDYAVVCGGSMMYVDAICKGIDDIPTISNAIREQVMADYQENGLDWMCDRLKQLDPAYFEIVDKNNHKRVIHAVEICLESGATYTELRKGTKKSRPFQIIKIGLTLPREDLFARINDRVEQMFCSGLIDEARSVYSLRNLNSLNTVGYKELFAYFDGLMDLNTAKERIKKNTRVYAKKQMTWYAKDPDIVWQSPHQVFL